MVVLVLMVVVCETGWREALLRAYDAFRLGRKEALKSPYWYVKSRRDTLLLVVY
jgi:hypothetical protein